MTILTAALLKSATDKSVVLPTICKQFKLDNGSSSLSLSHQLLVNVDSACRVVRATPVQTVQASSVQTVQASSVQTVQASLFTDSADVSLGDIPSSSVSNDLNTPSFSMPNNFMDSKPSTTSVLDVSLEHLATSLSSTSVELGYDKISARGDSGRTLAGFSFDSVCDSTSNSCEVSDLTRVETDEFMAVDPLPDSLSRTRPAYETSKPSLRKLLKLPGEQRSILSRISFR